MKTNRCFLPIGALLGAALSAIGQPTIQFSATNCQVPELAGKGHICTGARREQREKISVLSC